MGGNIHIDLNLWGHVGTCDTWFWSVNTTCPAGDLSFGPAARICEYMSIQEFLTSPGVFGYYISMSFIAKTIEKFGSVCMCTRWVNITTYALVRRWVSFGRPRSWLWSLLIIPHIKDDHFRKPRSWYTKPCAFDWYGVQWKHKSVKALAVRTLSFKPL